MSTQSIVPEAMPSLFQTNLNLVPLGYPNCSSSSPIQNSKNPAPFVIACGDVVITSPVNSFLYTVAMLFVPATYIVILARFIGCPS
ncbi:MAG: hypothetical protein EOL95_10155 [Bacteroidia bacterium]|nr:hypothetical protein [Bacteroidia bacterium]